MSSSATKALEKSSKRSEGKTRLRKYRKREKKRQRTRVVEEEEEEKKGKKSIRIIIPAMRKGIKRTRIPQMKTMITTIMARLKLEENASPWGLRRIS